MTLESDSLDMLELVDDAGVRVFRALLDELSESPASSSRVSESMLRRPAWRQVFPLLCEDSTQRLSYWSENRGALDRLLASHTSAQSMASEDGVVRARLWSRWSPFLRRASDGSASTCSPKLHGALRGAVQVLRRVRVEGGNGAADAFVPVRVLGPVLAASDGRTLFGGDVVDLDVTSAVVLEGSDSFERFVLPSGSVKVIDASTWTESLPSVLESALRLCPGFTSIRCALEAAGQRQLYAGDATQEFLDVLRRNVESAPATFQFYGGGLMSGGAAAARARAKKGEAAPEKGVRDRRLTADASAAAAAGRGRPSTIDVDTLTATPAGTVGSLTGTPSPCDRELLCEAGPLRLTRPVVVATECPGAAAGEGRFRYSQLVIPTIPTIRRLVLGAPRSTSLPEDWWRTADDAAGAAWDSAEQAQVERWRRIVIRSGLETSCREPRCTETHAGGPGEEEEDEAVAVLSIQDILAFSPSRKPLSPTGNIKARAVRESTIASVLEALRLRSDKRQLVETIATSYLSLPEAVGTRTIAEVEAKIDAIKDNRAALRNKLAAGKGASTFEALERRLTDKIVRDASPLIEAETRNMMAGVIAAIVGDDRFVSEGWSAVVVGSSTVDAGAERERRTVAEAIRDKMRVLLDWLSSRKRNAMIITLASAGDGNDTSAEAEAEAVPPSQQSRRVSDIDVIRLKTIAPSIPEAMQPSAATSTATLVTQGAVRRLSSPPENPPSNDDDGHLAATESEKDNETLESLVSSLAARLGTRGRSLLAILRPSSSSRSSSSGAESIVNRFARYQMQHHIGTDEDRREAWWAISRNAETDARTKIAFFLETLCDQGQTRLAIDILERISDAIHFNDTSASRLAEENAAILNRKAALRAERRKAEQELQIEAAATAA